MPTSNPATNTTPAHALVEGPLDPAQCMLPGCPSPNNVGSVDTTFIGAVPTFVDNGINTQITGKQMSGGVGPAISSAVAGKMMDDDGGAGL